MSADQTTPRFMTVHDLVSTLIQVGFADHGMGDYGEAIVQLTWDGEQFYAVDGITDYCDGGVVLQVEPWPPEQPDDTGHGPNGVLDLMAALEQSVAEAKARRLSEEADDVR